MKKCLVLVFLLGILLQIGLSNALLNHANITNPSQGSDLAANVNATWTVATPANATSHLNYYNLSLRYTNATKVQDFVDNTSTTRLSDLVSQTCNQYVLTLFRNVTVNSLLGNFSDAIEDTNGENYIGTYKVYYYDGTIQTNNTPTVSTSHVVKVYNFTTDNTKRVERIETYMNRTTSGTGAPTTVNFTYSTTGYNNNTYRYIDLTTVNISVGEYALFLESFDEYGTYTTNISFNLTRGAKRLTTNFLNESDGTTVGGNIAVDFISDTFSKTVSVTSGTATIILQPETYVIRYTAPSFTERNYYLTFSNNSDETINLYMIKNTTSSPIVFKIIDQDANDVEGAYVKALRYDISTNTYKTQEVGQTNTLGTTTLSLSKNDEFYKFIIEYEGTTYLVTTPAYITSDSYTFQIIISEDFVTPATDYNSISKTLDFLNSSSQFRLTYNIPSGLSTQVCLEVRKLGTSGLYNNSCTSSNAATILLGIVPESGKTFTATAYYYDGSTRNFLASTSNTYSQSVSFGRFGLFIQIIITTLSAFAIIVDLSLALIIIPGTLLIGYFIGLHTLSLAPIIVLMVVGLILAITIGRRGS